MRFRIYLIVVLLALTGCTYKMRPAGMFYQSFSVPDHIIKLAEPQLKFVQAGSSNGSSAGDPTQHRQSFDLLFDLNEDPEHSWNEELLIVNFWTAIQERLHTAGYRESGSGRQGNNLHLEYEARDSARHYGSIDVYFVRAENRQYKIFGVVREAVIEK